ncbi:MAG: rod shape-determining protein MreC [Phenylobacterium sp.]|uniref:rod shape-determining protein MreC n=1 Tax=Phenylobacterium sp. TaxID=1871053 RepID=UPI001A250007|nr:rod shape-determining protein MreC [Phenylobacterium sp.]MBJ7412931.1 rod shape-determining protein MreC [Phenylobacterium sp.]
MSLRDNPLGELRVPLTWTAGIVFIVVLIASVAILLSERREAFDTDAYGNPRTLSDKVMAPVGDALSTPGRLTGEGVEGIRGYFFAVSENRRLRAELENMRQWRDVAIALRDTNERYRTVLGLKTDPPIPMATARIVTDSRGPFAHSRLANAGSEKGIKPGNPVMSENGLVGRIVGVTEGVSRVLLLTDAASRTPVMIDRTNARAILTGDGGPNPKLEYLRGQEPVKTGDRILTSGDGGVFPRGLPVGVAVKGLDGRWRVVLASDKAPVDLVRILLFEDFTQVADTRKLEQTVTPPPTPGASTLPPPAPEAAAAAAPAPPSAPAAGGTSAAPATPAPKTTPPAQPAAKTATPQPKTATPQPKTATPPAKAAATPAPKAAAPQTAAPKTATTPTPKAPATKAPAPKAPAAKTSQPTGTPP